MKQKDSGAAQQIPDKVYFRIGEVSSLVGVDAHVLRYWESEFNIVRPRRASSKQRLYRRKDVEALLLIKDLLHDQGYTISGARKFLQHGGTVDETAGKESEPAAAEEKTLPASERLKDIKKELKRIQQLLALKSLRY